MGSSFASGDSIQGMPSPRWFVATFVVYVALGLIFRTVVLNWIVGPLWMFLTLFLLPSAVRWLIKVGRARLSGSPVQ